jgi:hypothetical protein
MSGIKVQGSATGAGNFTITPPNGGASDRTHTLPDRSGVLSLHDYPAFRVSSSLSSSAVTSGSWSKVPFNQVGFDTASCFDTALSRFTPNVPGYYQFNGVGAMTGTSATQWIASIYKNGSEYVRGTQVNGAANSNAQYMPVNDVVYMNGTTDYVELYIWVNGTSPVVHPGSCKFSGALVRIE